MSQDARSAATTEVEMNDPLHDALVAVFEAIAEREEKSHRVTKRRTLDVLDHPRQARLVQQVARRSDKIGVRVALMLEGQMFDGLNVHRPRLFETNWPLDVPVLRAPPPRQTKMGRPPLPGEAMQVVGHFSDVPAGRKAMGIDWMTQGELAQAIPPAYTEFIGRQLLTHVRQEVAA